MKRGFLILTIMVMCLFLSSCGKSEAAINADNMILEIGEITLKSGAKIIDAEEAVSNLKESEYEQLEYISVLKEARATYDQLVEETRIANNNKAISEIEAAIDSIGTVTLEQESAIVSARTLYDKSLVIVLTDFTFIAPETIIISKNGIKITALIFTCKFNFLNILISNIFY